MVETSERPAQAHRRPSIERISSQGVFGEFGYDVDFESTSHQSGRVVVIYAENGMGKTNFLKAVHHLLTPRLESLQALADLFVEDLSITLHSGVKISLSKATEPESLFDCTIDYPEGNEQHLPTHITVRQEDVDSRSFRRSALRPGVSKYLDELRKLVNPTILVGDDRLVYSGADSGVTSVRRGFETERDNARGRPRSIQSVRDALDRVERFFTRATLAGISTDSVVAGEGVYVEITKRVLAGNSQSSLAAAARVSLTEQAERLLESATDYEKYGLMSFQQVRRITSEIRAARANNQHFRPLQGILEPYLSNMVDRVEALAPAQRIIDTFVTSVNSFLERKELTFSATDGIRLMGKLGDELEPDNLSSGEKHLLLLLSNAVLARTSGALVIIDEPELSLGLRWQRQLLSELLRCTEDSGVQFLVASHSVQIMGDIDEVIRPSEVR